MNSLKFFALIGLMVLPLHFAHGAETADTEGNFLPPTHEIPALTPQEMIDSQHDDPAADDNFVPQASDCPNCVPQDHKSAKMKNLARNLRSALHLDEKCLKAGGSVLTCLTNSGYCPVVVRPPQGYSKLKPGSLVVYDDQGKKDFALKVGRDKYLSEGAVHSYLRHARIGEVATAWRPCPR